MREMSDVDENRYPLFRIVPKRGTDYGLPIGGFDRECTDARWRRVLKLPARPRPLNHAGR
jgi:hypothetical protein